MIFRSLLKIPIKTGGIRLGFPFALASALFLFVVLFLASSSPVLADYGIEHSQDGIVIDLSDPTLDAIDNGVSLTFVCEFAVIKRWGIFSWKTRKKKYEFVISKHALSDRYHVHKDDNPSPTIFQSSLMSVLQISKQVKRLYREHLKEQPNTEVRIYLSKTDLPAPMRMAAFASSQWNFDSGWVTWPIVN